MPQLCVKDIYEWLNNIAPFDQSEEFDNVGLLIGRMDQAVSGVMVALDITPDVILEAAKANVNLLISHHPLMFQPIQRVLTNEYEGMLLSQIIQHGMCLIAAHTNIDRTTFSGSARLADVLNLHGTMHAEPYLFIGCLHDPQPAGRLEATLSDTLKTKVKRFGDPATEIHKIAIAGGAYSEGYLQAAKMGAQALITGEVRHHHAVAAAQSGFVLFEAGHHVTEAPMAAFLAECLQKHVNELKYNVRVCALSSSPY